MAKHHREDVEQPGHDELRRDHRHQERGSRVRPDLAEARERRAQQAVPAGAHRLAPDLQARREQRRGERQGAEETNTEAAPHAATITALMAGPRKPATPSTVVDAELPAASSSGLRTMSGTSAWCTGRVNVIAQEPRPPRRRTTATGARRLRAAAVASKAPACSV